MIEWLFCYLRTSQGEHEIDWLEEAETVVSLGFTCHGIDLERLIEGRIDEALESLPKGEGQTLVYRGWMIKDEEYSTLEDAVTAKGYQLLTNTQQYSGALRLPNYYERIEGRTPPAVWTWDSDIDEAWELAQAFAPGPYIVRDHIKSRKEEWLDACFIEKGADFAEFKRVCENLIAWRGERFEGGIVVRPFIKLATISRGFTGVPVHDEYRLVFWRGSLVLASPYYEFGGDDIDFSEFVNLGESIDSPLFVADVAKCADGSLTLIEINDGGCAGIPMQVDPLEYYRAIAKAEGLEIEADPLLD